MDDTTFASCGADRLVHIMRLGNPEPLRTLEYVNISYANAEVHINFRQTGGTQMK